MIVLTVIGVVIFFIVGLFGVLLAVATDGERERNPDYWESIRKMQEMRDKEEE